MTCFKPPKSINTPLLFSSRDLLKIVIPLIIQQVLAVTVGAIDTMMVSHAGEAAVSGVSLVNTLDVLLVLFFTSLVSGGTVVVAQSLGKKNSEEARAAAKQLLYVATGIAILVTTVVLLLRKPLLNLLFGDVEPDVMLSAEKYFFYVALSFPFLAIESGIAALFRAVGNSMISMVVSFVINLINVGGNALLIVGYELGSAGAAISTLFARFVGTLIMLILIKNKNSVIYIEHLLSYKPDGRVIREILHIGIPNGIENGMFQFGKLLTQTLISSMGTAAIAANAVALTISNFQYMAGTAYSNTMVTVVGRCIGAKETEQAKYYSRLMTVLNYLTLWLVVIVTVIFLSPIVAIYDLSPTSTDLAKELILYHSVCAAVMWPIAFMLPSAFRAASDVRFPLVVSMFSMWIFRVAGSYYLALDTLSIFKLWTLDGLGMGVMGVWVAMTIDWVFRTVLFLIRYLSGKWLLVKNRTKQ